MKKFNISIIVLLFILSCSFLLLSFENQKVAGESETPYSLMGWLWSENYGWISLNSGNCINVYECNSKGINYSVNISSSTNEISGYGWSEYIGWICFGSTCAGIEDDSPPTGQFKAEYSSSTGRISGWAKVLSLESDGWIHLGSEQVSATRQSLYPACYNCEAECEEWATVEEGEESYCIKNDDLSFESCKTCFTATKFDGEDIPTEIDSAVGGGSGNICENCSECEKKEDLSENFRVECKKCSNCKKYGSALDLNTGSLLGWAWNGYNKDNNGIYQGIGWINFYGLAKVLAPWLETQYGSIFTQKGIRQWAGSGGNNATFCIYAQTLENMKTSSQCPTDPIRNVAIEYPSTNNSNIYRNALGKIDIYGLTTSTKTINNVKYNKYGNVIENFVPSDEIFLENKIYVSAGNVTIVNPLQIQNGFENGNGTIVVNGNLNINNNVTYDSAATDLKKLASVAWIVKGDLIIDGNVDNLAGIFIVLGNGSECLYENGLRCNNSDQYPKYKANGHGIVFSGASNKSLTIHGLLAAKAFDFRRYFADMAMGSERIIYDGRLIANPPPGFASFAEGMPVIRDFEYSN